MRRWHLAWFAATALAALVWPAAASGSTATSALAVSSLGAVGGIALAGRSRAASDSLILVFWALSAGAAVVLSGGLAGPLAPFALMPLAAGTLLGSRRNVAAGAALAVAVVATAGLGGMIQVSAREPRPWLTGLAVVLTAAAMATAAVLAARRSGAAPATGGADQEPYRSLLQAQGLLILDLTAEGGVREVLGALFHPFTDDQFARGLAGLAAEPAPLEAALAQAPHEGRIEIGFAPAGAEDRWVVAVLTPWPGGVIAVLSDGSAIRSREAVLEQAVTEAVELNEGKSRFLANMSHELRTPLNAVVGFSDIMRSQMFGPLAPKYAEYAELIHESGGHLLDLINDVLDLSKIEAERYELSLDDFDAREAVSSALRLVRVQADNSEIRLQGILGTEPITVRADRRAVKQIVLNLVSNALKFTPAGGSVTVGLRGFDGFLELVVGDTGVGISAADLERLGRPYEQAGGADQKALGSGLGLSLVRALSELHGGETTIQSTLGEGTVVAVRLPVLIAQASAQAEPAAVLLGDNVIAFNPNR